MTKQDPVEGRQKETNLEIMTKQEPVEGRQRETNLEIMMKQDPVEGRQRETNLEITTKQEPVEGRQRETNLEIIVVTKFASLKELRTPSAEAVWGKERTKTQLFKGHKPNKRPTKLNLLPKKQKP